MDWSNTDTICQSLSVFYLAEFDGGGENKGARGRWYVPEFDYLLVSEFEDGHLRPPCLQLEQRELLDFPGANWEDD